MALGPVTIRLITNIVLMISDIDVFFSIMFLVQLYRKGGTFIVFMLFCIGGMLVYMAGVVIFAPRQKYKTPKNVIEMMENQPDQFVWEGKRISPNSPLDPKQPKSATNRTFEQCSQFTTFDEKEKKNIDCSDFKRGLANYGLLAAWTAAEKRNSRNRAEIKHGVPFLRLAKFGFMATPQPKDLGGILNTNALYSFTNGIPQMLFGIYLFSLEGPSLELLLPLSIAGVSFLLSLANIFLDFGAKLLVLQGEDDTVADIQSRVDVPAAEKKRSLEKEYQEKINRIDSHYKDKSGAATMEAMSKEKHAAFAHFTNHLQDDDARNMKLIADGIQRFRHKLIELKKAKTGALKKAQKEREEEYAQMQEELAPFEAKIKAVRDQKGKDVTAIAVQDEAQMRVELQRVTKEAENKIQLLNDAMNEIRKRYSFDNVT